MKIVLKSISLIVLFAVLAMADLPMGKFKFNMKSTLKANKNANEQLLYLLKNMSKDIKIVSVAKGKKVILEGQNRKGKARKQTFTYEEVSKNSYRIPAGRGMEVTSLDSKHLTLGLAMQNGKVLHLVYTLMKY